MALATHNVVAAFLDEDRLEGALRALAEQDIPRSAISVDDRDDEVALSKFEMREEVERSWAGPGVSMGTEHQLKGAVLWTIVGGVAGLVIGLRVDRAFVAEVGRLGIATLVAVTGQLLLWLGTGYVLTRAFDGDRITALFASGPGGMSEMISSATQAGGDGAVVGFVHLIRLSSIIALVPTVIVPFVTG